LSGAGRADPRLVARLNECIALFQKGRAEQALAGVRKVLEKAPGHPDANHIAGAALVALNRPEQALYHGERAAKAVPANGRYRLLVGSALMALNREGDAAESFETALRLLPGDPEALAGLGAAWSQTGRYAEAEDLLRRAAAARPGWGDPAMTLGTMLLRTARAHDAVEVLRPLVEADQRLIPAADSLALASSYDDAITPREAFECHALFGRCVEAFMPRCGPHANSPDPGRRIRLAYLSAELRNHSNSFFLRPILEHHDRERFEVICYHTSRHEDAVTAELRKHTDRWVACDQLNPPQLAQRIHQDRVDILVELTGHFGRNRLATMAARPAPVQVTYLGYGNTTGLTTIDARIVDRDTDPEPEADALATERLVRLDRCFLAYRPDDDAPEPAEPGERAFTFGSFNDIKKISPSAVRVWSKILHECPGSRLLLKTGELSHAPMRDMLAARFGDQGIGPDRLTLTGRIESDRGHLALYDEVDLALDTFPYAGTTTTCQALWQGVPVLTLAGRAHAGRVGVSLLRAAGEDDLIAADEDAYAAKARSVFENGRIGQSERLARRGRMAACPLLDHAGLTRAVEAVYVDLWAAWCERGSAR
jgi:predicted O-linked N-acetylglucosamine transferase (SPINDLY family)